jgi:hypothetical protein
VLDGSESLLFETLRRDGNCTKASEILGRLLSRTQNISNARSQANAVIAPWTH